MTGKTELIARYYATYGHERSIKIFEESGFHFVQITQYPESDGRYEQSLEFAIPKNKWSIAEFDKAVTLLHTKLMQS